MVPVRSKAPFLHGSLLIGFHCASVVQSIPLGASSAKDSIVRPFCEKLYCMSLPLNVLIVFWGELRLTDDSIVCPFYKGFDCVSVRQKIPLCLLSIVCMCIIIILIREVCKHMMYNTKRLR